MSEQVVNKAFDYIDAIAEKLGVAAEHVYEVLVRQQISEGISMLLVSIVFLTIGLIVIFKTLNSGFDYDKYGNIDNTPKNIVKVSLLTVFGICALISLIFLAVDGYSAVLKIYNPEYYAIKEILGVISGNK